MQRPFSELSRSPALPVVVKPLGWADPLSVFAPFAHHEGAVFLDSALVGDSRSCWSVIGLQPQSVMLGTVEAGFTRDGFPVNGTLSDVLKEFAFTVDTPESLPQGAPLPGVLGYLGFEAGVWCDAMPMPKEVRLLPDMWLGRYETLAIFHHATGQSWLVSAAPMLSSLWEEFCQSFGYTVKPHTSPFSHLNGTWQPDTHATDYPRMVEAVVEHIAAGDVFQINATWQFKGELPENSDAFELYTLLRQRSPAPFSAFLRLNDEQALVSASPELFLQLDAQGRVMTRPIKGTRPRDANPRKDMLASAELQLSPKDRAENLMIVDLMRNDLGRVCRIGSVDVPRLWEVESFPAVHHLVSEIRGVLDEGRSAIDLLCASFPPGSVTGAPKVHCLELINRLEPVPRGAYCGSLIHLGGDGSLNSSVLIRTMVVNGRLVTAQAGGGIVSDSVPEDECAEMLVKAQAMRQALAGADSL